MKRYIRSSYYSTKEEYITPYEMSEPDYGPWSYPSIKPEGRSAKSGKLITVIDKLEPSIQTIYNELKTYKGSIIEPIAQEIRYNISQFDNPSRKLRDDEVDTINNLITSIRGLEILESAIEQFVQKTGIIPNDISLGGVYILGDTPNTTCTLIDRSEIDSICKGDYLANEVVTYIMMPRFKKYQQFTTHRR